MGWFEERFQDLHGRLRFDCIACSRPMWFPKSKHGKYVTCGNVCAAAKHESVKNARKRSCATCGGEFLPRSTQLKIGAGIYCSQACNKKAHDAMNSKTAHLRASRAWKATHLASPIVKSGPENKRWTGGPFATYKRQIESGKRRIYWQNRRARGGTARASSSVVQTLGAYQKWKCAACRCSIKKKFEVDHIMPVARGGTTEDKNLQLLCVSCNRRKSHKHPIDFMQANGFLL